MATLGEKARNSVHTEIGNKRIVVEIAVITDMSP